jgi:ParB-like chromosome segregation protein Spo0J
LKPINVEPLGDGKFLVTDGNRRLASAKKAGLQSLKCVVGQKLDDSGRKLLQAQIDAQTKLFEGRDKYALWRKLWATGNFDKKSFMVKLGVSEKAVSDFFDYEGLSPAIKKLDVNPGLLQETKSLKKDVREKVIKYAHKTGKGAMALRADVRVLKDAEDTLVDAFVDQHIDKDDVAKLKGLSKKQQVDGIETIKHFKKQLKTIPDLVVKGEVNTVVSPAVLSAQQFVNKLQVEIAKTAIQLSALEGVLAYIEDNKLDDHFTPVMKSAIVNVLSELSENVGSSATKIDGSLKRWRLK